jgi:hypothetical protein
MQETKSIFREKRKDKGKGPTPLACKKKKYHKDPTIYTLTNDGIDRIGYQVKDFAEEAVEQASCK